MIRRSAVLKRFMHRDRSYKTIRRVNDYINAGARHTINNKEFCRPFVSASFGNGNSSVPIFNHDDDEFSTLLEHYVQDISDTFFTEHYSQNAKRIIIDAAGIVCAIDQPAVCNNIMQLLKQHQLVRESIDILTQMKLENPQDLELHNSVERELDDNIKRKRYLQYQVAAIMMALQQDGIGQSLPVSTINNITLEVCCGVGGQEAMLFADELHTMYCNYVRFRNWHYELAQYENAQFGGLRAACILISGIDCFRLLRHEAGVHRVQRVPATEKSGRMHTSTASVAVLPTPSNIEVVIHDKDIKMDTKQASGPGGQHAHTTLSAVRIHHIPTGTIVECQVHRSQDKNRRIALDKLRTLLYEQQLNHAQSLEKSARKMQVGSRFRNEKIRTYNYSQDRITDHRFGITVHNLPEFLNGGQHFNRFIECISQAEQHKQSQSFIERLRQAYHQKPSKN